ncbi:MAG: HEAT repeat domain-containing protein [Armatimonadetes bacterium]|nr:HEAT repeat domain-containing protein [Armatimonadota bacterium]
MRTTRLAVIMLCGLASGLLAQADSPEAVVQALMSDDAATRKAAEADAVRLGAPMVAPLCDLMAKGDSKSVTVAEKALFAIVADASRPGMEPLRQAMSRTLAEQVATARSDRARSQATLLLGVCGRSEALPALAKALTEPGTFDAAVSALQRLAAKGATRTLAAAVATASAERRPALLLALGARRDAEALKTLTPFVRGPDGPARIAAVRALGLIGSSRSAGPLKAAMSKGDPETQDAALAALLAVADRQRLAKPRVAHALYGFVKDQAKTDGQRQAAQLGLEATKGPTTGLVARETTLRAHIDHIRWGIVWFRTQCGDYPRRLADLVAVRAPTRGGNGRPIPSADFRGPYMTTATGRLPENPLTGGNVEGVDWLYEKTTGIVRAKPGIASDLTDYATW